LREGCGEVFRDTVAEILLLGVVTHIDERQHDERGFVG
jgi:hypothetical protein